MNGTNNDGRPISLFISKSDIHAPKRPMILLHTRSLLTNNSQNEHSKKLRSALPENKKETNATKSIIAVTNNNIDTMVCISRLFLFSFFFVFIYFCVSFPRTSSFSCPLSDYANIRFFHSLRISAPFFILISSFCLFASTTMCHFSSLSPLSVPLSHRHLSFSPFLLSLFLP